MLRCFSSLGCPEFSFDDTLALAARHGIPAVELRALGGTIDLPGYLAAQFGTPEQLASHRRATRTPVRLAALDASLHLIGATPAEREQLTALAPWAEALDVPWMRVFDGGRIANDAEVTEAVSTLHWWRKLRRERGWQVEVMVETHDSLFTAAAITRLLAAAPEAAILWDTHHTWRKGGEDPVVTWPAIRDRVVHVHVKDSIGVASAKHPFTYVLPGDGEFPMAPLRAALRADHYAGSVSLEWEKMWHPYLAPLEEALRAATACAWW